MKSIGKAGAFCPFRRSRNPLKTSLLVMTIFLCLAGLQAHALPAAQASPELSNPLQLVADHATASVADLQKEEQWYIGVLGFREVNHIHRGDDFEACRVSIPGFSIDLVLRKGSRRSDRRVGNLEQGWLHVVFKTQAVERTYSALMAAHTDVQADREKGGSLSRLLVHDPEGNELEIFAE